MMHTKALGENRPPHGNVATHGNTAWQGSPRAVPRPLRPGWLAWLAPWSRLRMQARDGGPPQWPLPWR